MELKECFKYHVLILFWKVMSREMLLINIEIILQTRISLTNKRGVNLENWDKSLEAICEFLKTCVFKQGTCMVYVAFP